MEFEDSRFALFSEPNAYIQSFRGNKEKTKKVVFQEPYETLPNYYINNNFKKRDCDCVQNNGKHKDKCDCKCNHDSFNQNQNGCDHGFRFNEIDCNYQNKNHDCKCNNGDKKQNGFNFDLKNLMPLLGLFNKGGGVDLSNLVGILGNGDKKQNENNSNPMNLISSILSNKDTMGGILNLFMGGGFNLFNKTKPAKKEIKTTDFEIKNYTRVE